MAYFSVHNHSQYSNIRLIDSIVREEELIRYANSIGLKGIVLSDHETLAGHVKFIKAYKKMKKNNELAEDFKIGLGNEIYLVKEDNLEELRENYANKDPETKFYHFLLLAKNEQGYQQLRILSSMAWENMFKTGRMERVPTFKNSLKEVVNKGDIVATSACLGGFVGQKLLRIRESLQENNKETTKLHQKELLEFIDFCVDVFGQDDFYLEMQPSANEEQKYVNRQIINLANKLGLRYIVATDAHYLKKEDRDAHRVYLQSQDGDREVDDFYDATYVFSEAEIYEALEDHLTKEEIKTALDNTMKIHEDIEFFDLFHKTIIPHADIPEFKQRHLFKKAYGQYEYIEKFAYSEHSVDRYFLHLIEKGVEENILTRKDFSKEYLHKTLDRINTELRELWLISIRLEDRMSAYYVLTQEVVDVIWNEGDSILGVSRGSAGGYLVNFLVGITQINPMDYDLPHFRHLTAERPELPDC